MRGFLLALLLLSTGFNAIPAHAAEDCTATVAAICTQATQCAGYDLLSDAQEIQLCQANIDDCKESEMTKCNTRNEDAATAASAKAKADADSAKAAAKEASVAPSSITLANPLGEQANDPRLLVARLIQAMIALSGGIALVMFIYAGLLFLTAGGAPGPIGKAKILMLYVILGIVIIAGAYVATNTIFTAVLTGDPVVHQGGG